MPDCFGSRLFDVFMSSARSLSRHVGLRSRKARAERYELDAGYGATAPSAGLPPLPSRQPAPTHHPPSLLLLLSRPFLWPVYDELDLPPSDAPVVVLLSAAACASLYVPSVDAEPGAVRAPGLGLRASSASRGQRRACTRLWTLSGRKEAMRPVSDTRNHCGRRTARSDDRVRGRDPKLTQLVTSPCVSRLCWVCTGTRRWPTRGSMLSCRM